MALTIDAHQNGIVPGKLDMTPELRNGLMTVRQLPILVFKHAEFLSYGRTQYDSAEKYYRRAMEVRPSPRAVPGLMSSRSTLAPSTSMRTEH